MPVAPAFAISRKGYPPRDGMSEIMSVRACQGNIDAGQRRIRRIRWPRKKHGEVSFPTQVRYDIVFFIGPIIIITALR